MSKKIYIIALLICLTACSGNEDSKISEKENLFNDKESSNQIIEENLTADAEIELNRLGIVTHSNNESLVPKYITKNELIGRWNLESITKTDGSIVRLTDLYGSYARYGYVTFNDEDYCFEIIIGRVSDGEEIPSDEPYGAYTIAENVIKIGERYNTDFEYRYVPDTNELISYRQFPYDWDEEYCFYFKKDNNENNIEEIILEMNSRNGKIKKIDFNGIELFVFYPLESYESVLKIYGKKSNGELYKIADSPIGTYKMELVENKSTKEKMYIFFGLWGDGICSTYNEIAQIRKNDNKISMQSLFLEKCNHKAEKEINREVDIFEKVEKWKHVSEYFVHGRRVKELEYNDKLKSFNEEYNDIYNVIDVWEIYK